MKVTKITLLTALLLSLTFTACTTTEKVNIETDAQQASNSTRKFPTIIRPDNNVTCLNCYATFKLSMGIQKQSHGHSYIACPICHHNYLKKAK